MLQHMCRKALWSMVENVLYCVRARLVRFGPHFGVSVMSGIESTTYIFPDKICGTHRIF